MIRRFASLTSLAVLSLLSAYAVPQPCAAQPGPAPSGTAIAEYIRATGEIIVSVANVSNWYVESLSGGLTGPDDVTSVLPLAPNSTFVTNNTSRAGELAFGGDFSYTDINLGAIAAASLANGDLSIFWNGAGTGTPLESQAVVYIGGPVGQPGDFNDDNDVLGDDFIVWQRGETTPALDAGLLAEWESNYGTVSASVATAQIPEPASLSLLALGSLALAGRRKRRS